MKKLLLTVLMCLIATAVFAEKVNLKAKELKLYNGDDNKTDIFFRDKEDANATRLMKSYQNLWQYAVIINTDNMKKVFGSTGMLLDMETETDGVQKLIVVPFNTGQQTNNENINAFLNELVSFLENDKDEVKITAKG